MDLEVERQELEVEETTKCEGEAVGSRSQEA